MSLQLLLPILLLDPYSLWMHQCSIWTSLEVGDSKSIAYWLTNFGLSECPSLWIFYIIQELILLLQLIIENHLLFPSKMRRFLKCQMAQHKKTISSNSFLLFFLIILINTLNKFSWSSNFISLAKVIFFQSYFMKCIFTF